jgi:hypothetical protein
MISKGLFQIRGLIMSILRKIIIIPVVTIQGLLIGLFLNFFWHFFLAEIIGWADTAPDWYFNIQKTVFVCIFLFGLIGWIIFSLRPGREPWTFTRHRVWKELSREDASY